MAFGDRKDGRRLRTIAPMSVVSPYIMDTRAGCQNKLYDNIDVTNVEKYICEKKASGNSISFMHVLVAAYIRTVSQMPAINRFIAGQRIYARKDITIALTIKQEMSLSSPDTAIKVTFSPDATVFDVCDGFNKAINEYRENPGGDFDDTAKVLTYIPGLLLKLTIKILRLMDYFGHLPKAIEKVSPFHASMFITSMGSLGIPAIYHHLYDFGVVPLFIAFGAKKRVNEIDDNGNVKKVPYVDISFVMDERICDGYYFAAAYKSMKKYLKNPELLEAPPENVIEDIK